VFIETGNVGGGVAAGENFFTGFGFSVGSESPVTPVDNHFDTFPLVVLGSADLNTGAIFPAQSPIFIQGFLLAMEEPDFVARRVTCTNNCPDAAFASVETCYENLSPNLSARTPNTNIRFQYGTLAITCTTAQPFRIVDISATLFNQVTSYQLIGCNPADGFLINIQGSSPVTFSGNGFPIVGGGVIYNIPAASTVTVGAAQVNGNILAPFSQFTQTGGQVNGEVIVANVVDVLSLSPEICS